MPENKGNSISRKVLTAEGICANESRGFLSTVSFFWEGQTHWKDFDLNDKNLKKFATPPKNGMGWGSDGKGFLMISVTTASS
jgi:hypothetical protein